MSLMKSEYLPLPNTYQDSEPLNYLQNYTGIRQISVEKVEIFRAEYLKCLENKAKFAASLDNDGNDCLVALFNTPVHTFSDDN